MGRTSIPKCTLSLRWRDFICLHSSSVVTGKQSCQTEDLSTLARNSRFQLPSKININSVVVCSYPVPLLSTGRALGLHNRKIVCLVRCQKMLASACRWIFDSIEYD